MRNLWAKFEIFMGLAGFACGLVFQSFWTIPVSVLGCYLAMAGHRSHVYSYLRWTLTEHETRMRTMFEDAVKMKRIGSYIVFRTPTGELQVVGHLHPDELRALAPVAPSVN
jgi:hypothetical protein